LKPRRVRFTETANQHVDRERAWWLENRDQHNLFASELEKALEIAALLPGAGTPYTQATTPDLRRLYIRKLGCHLYYTFDADDVIIRALWGARRERGPTF
jgi:plasmid stabilization system protein ParE